MAHISREKTCMLGTQFHFLGENIITKTNKARYTRQPRYERGRGRMAT